MSQLNERKRLAAIEALGDLGDAKAIVSLEKFMSNAEDSPERKNAATAIEKLRVGRKPVDDFKNLRKEVTDLRKANQDMAKQMEALKKRFEAAFAPAGGQKAKTKEK